MNTTPEQEKEGLEYYRKQAVAHLDVTPEERKKEFTFLKNKFDLTNFLDFFESNGFVGDMERKVNSDDRLSYLRDVFTEFYPELKGSFFPLIVNAYQKKHPSHDLSMCEFLDISLNDEGYIKMCSCGEKPKPTPCIGSNKYNCSTYLDPKYDYISRLL